jgi:hypothetical protein
MYQYVDSIKLLRDKHPWHGQVAENGAGEENESAKRSLFALVIGSQNQ